MPVVAALILQSRHDRLYVLGASALHDQQRVLGVDDDHILETDEDIVAKQLREAALAEEDPELRERLWAEYRKYNGL